MEKLLGIDRYEFKDASGRDAICGVELWRDETRTLHVFLIDRLGNPGEAVSGSIAVLAPQVYRTLMTKNRQMGVSGFLSVDPEKIVWHDVEVENPRRSSVVVLEWSRSGQFPPNENLGAANPQWIHGADPRP